MFRLLSISFLSLFLYFPALALELDKYVELSVGSVTTHSYNKEKNTLTNILANVVLTWRGVNITEFKINGHRNNLEEKFYLDQFCPENNADQCLSAKYLDGFENFVADLDESKIEHLSAKCFSLTYIFDDILDAIKKEVELKDNLIEKFYSSRQKSFENLGKRCLRKLEKLDVTNEFLVAHTKIREHEIANRVKKDKVRKDQLISSKERVGKDQPSKEIIEKEASYKRKKKDFERFKKQLATLKSEEYVEIETYLKFEDNELDINYITELSKKRLEREELRKQIFQEMAEQLKQQTTENMAIVEKVRILRELSKNYGNPYADFAIGAFMQENAQTEEDLRTSFVYMKKAANSGLMPARTLLANFYIQGIGTRKSESAAVWWWVASIAQGSKASIKEMTSWANKSDAIAYVLGTLYLDKMYIEQDPRKARKYLGFIKNKFKGADIKWLEASVLAGDYEAYLALGLRLKNGDGIKKNKDRALQMLFEASKGIDDIRKKKRAELEYLKLSALNGVSESAYQLGILKLKEKRVDEALRWFHLLDGEHYKDTDLKVGEIYAEKGVPWAQYEMAQIFDKGIEVERNVEKALKYLEKLADINYKNSLFLKTKLLAEKKDKKALFVFGKYLEEGKEIKKNNQEALKYYDASANKNYLDAKIKLAQIYRLGLLGTEKDFDLSLTYYKSAVEENGYSLNKVYGYIEKFAEAGSKDAALWLGDMHYYAKIKSASEKTALTFFKQAQDNGSKEAENKIEELSKCLNESKGFFSSIFSRSDNSLGACILNGHYAMVNSHIDVEEEKKIVACSNFTRAFSNDPRAFDKYTNEPSKRQKNFSIRRLFKNSIDTRAYNLKGQSFTGMKGFPIMFTEEPSGASLSKDERTGEQLLVIASNGYVETFTFRNKTKLIPTSHSCDRGKACTKDFKNLMGSFINVSKNLHQLCRLDQWPDGKQPYESASSLAKKKVNFGSSTSGSNSYKANSPYRAEIKCLDVSGFETRLDLCFSDRLSFMKIKIGPTERNFDQMDMLQGGLRAYNFRQFDQVLKIDLPKNNWLVAVRNYSEFYNVIIEVKNRYGEITYSGNSKNGMLAGTRLN